MTKSVWVIALMLPVTGCALFGFDPVGAADDGVSGDGNSGGSGPGTGGSSDRNPMAGSGGAPSGGGGGGGGSSGSSGSGGSSDASVFMPGTGGDGPDATVPATQCTGKSNFSSCDDGSYCTEGDFCWDDVCVPGDDEPVCGDSVCETSFCDEASDSCQTTNALDGTACLANTGACFGGRCSSTNFTCPDGGECDPICLAGVCVVNCQNATSCDIDCTSNSVCTTDCRSAGTCDFECTDASSCTFDCGLTGTCTGVCTGGSTCGVICTDASGCEDIRCLDGSRCKLRCLEEESCGFAECWTEQEDCGDGTTACGIACGGM